MQFADHRQFQLLADQITLFPRTVSMDYHLKQAQQLYQKEETGG
jgi:hypothetical protein